MLELSIFKVLIPALFSFLLGILMAPKILNFLYKKEVWKKKAGNEKGLGDNKGTPIFNKLHKEKDVKTPRMGGLVIVFSVFLTIVVFWSLSFFLTGGPSGKTDFLSRDQTWLIFATFLFGAIIGFFDDFFTIKKEGLFAGGISIKYRLLAVAFFSFFISLWFYFNLEMTSIKIPFYGDFFLGIFFIPFFILVFVSLFATSNIDGLDGLAGGIMAIIYGAYGFISFFYDQINISAFCFTICGSVLAFLWFNIPPAKFYMTEVGYTALSLTLGVIAFLTDTVILLPIIAFMLFFTEITTILQVLSKKFRGKKIFLSAPIHHHFEALGMKHHTIVMKYWIISAIFAIFGAILAVMG